MKLLCRHKQKQMMAALLEGRRLSRKDQDHLDRCEDCRKWYARQKELDAALSAVPRAEPPDHLDARVMAFICRKEEARQQAPKARHRRRYALPPVLRREAWPIALATLSLVWGLWISPAIEAQQNGEAPDSSVVTWVTSLPENLDRRCANLQLEIAERLATIIEPVKENGGSNETSYIPVGPVTIT